MVNTGKRYLVVRNMEISKAHALNGTYAIGIPPMSAWLGFMTALERNLNNRISFNGIAVNYSVVKLYTYKGYGDYYASVITTSNPMVFKNDNTNGELVKPSFIENPKVDLMVSLLFDINTKDDDLSVEDIRDTVFSMKACGGDINRIGGIKIFDTADTKETDIINKLGYGYAIKEANKDLIYAQSNDDEDALKNLLSFFKTYYVEEPSKNADGTYTYRWKGTKQTEKCLTPISVGYMRLTPYIKTKNQRDLTKKHAFVENIVTLGEFELSYRVKRIKDILWHYDYSDVKGLYLCKNRD